MYIYKHNYYDSESDESDNGARCCTTAACPPTKPIELSALTLEIWTPPPNHDPNNGGHSRQLVGISTNFPEPVDPLYTDTNYDTAPDIQQPDEGSNIPYGVVLVSPDNWVYDIYFSISQDDLNDAGYNYDINDIIVDGDDGETITVSSVTTPFVWNGTTVFNSNQKPFRIRKDLSTIPPDLDIGLRVAVKLQFQQNANCDAYYTGFGAEAQQTTTALPAACLYKNRCGPTNSVVSGGDNWQEHACAFSIAECEDLTIKGFKVMEYDQNSNNIEWSDFHFKHNVTQAHWDTAVPGFTPTKLELKFEQKNLIGWPSNKGRPGGLETVPPAFAWHITNAGVPVQFNVPPSSGNSWPDALVVPSYEKSTGYDDNTVVPYAPPPASTPGTPGETIIRIFWAPAFNQQATLALRYRWTDDVTDVVHYSTIRVQKGVYTPRSLTLPLNPCWNSDINYDYSTPSDWASKTTVLYQAPVQRPLFYKDINHAVDTTAYSSCYVSTNSANTSHYPRISVLGAQTGDFSFEMPFFFDGTNWSFVWGDCTYERRDGLGTYGGSPRNTTWGICNPNGGAGLGGGNFNFNQFGNNTVSLANATTARGLLYVNFNLNAWPRGSDGDTVGVNTVGNFQTRLPTDCQLKTIDAKDFVSWAQQGLSNNNTLNAFSAVGSAQTDFTLTIQLDDIYPGDNGRSITLYTLQGADTATLNINIFNPDTSTYQKIPSRGRWSNTLDRCWETISVRKYFDPQSNYLTMQFQNTRPYSIGGIHYLAQV